MFGIFLHAARYCAFDLICSRSPLFLIIGIGNDPSIDLAVVMSLFNVVTIVSRGLPLNPLSDFSK